MAPAAQDSQGLSTAIGGHAWPGTQEGTAPAEPLLFAGSSTGLTTRELGLQFL